MGVFVSIVSTKIPYKGAGKEYIGMHPLLPICTILDATVTPLSFACFDGHALLRCPCPQSKQLLEMQRTHQVCNKVLTTTVLCVVAADDMDELVHAVKQAIQQCGLQV